MCLHILCAYISYVPTYPMYLHRDICTSIQIDVQMSQVKTIGHYYYHLGGQLGQGCFATVYKGYNSSNGQIVAIKEIQIQRLEKLKDYHKLIDNLSNEITTLRRLQHINIIQLIDVLQVNIICM